MTKLTVSFVRQVMNEFHNEEITFSRMVEKLNEEAVVIAIQETVSVGDVLIAINACEMDNGEGNALIIGKEYTVDGYYNNMITIKSETNNVHWFDLLGNDSWVNYFKKKS